MNFFIKKRTLFQRHTLSKDFVLKNLDSLKMICVLSLKCTNFFFLSSMGVALQQIIKRADYIGSITSVGLAGEKLLTSGKLSFGSNGEWKKMKNLTILGRAVVPGA